MRAMEKQLPKVNHPHVWRWEFEFAVPRCHKWFRCLDSNRLAVCDYSGSEPHLTDDGVLWLQERQRIMVVGTDYYSNPRPRIWLIDESGEEKLLGGTLIAEARELVDRGLAFWHYD